MGSRAKSGTFAGAFRKRNPLSDGVAKPVSQFCIYIWKAHFRMVPRQKKEERRGRKGRRGGEGRGTEMSPTAALDSLVIQVNKQSLLLKSVSLASCRIDAGKLPTSTGQPPTTICQTFTIWNFRVVCKLLGAFTSCNQQRPE